MLVRLRKAVSLFLMVPLALIVTLSLGCSPADDGASEPAETGGEAATAEPDSYDRGLLLAIAALDKDEEGRPKPLPARMGMLRREDGQWKYSYIEDEESNVFHKAMVHPDAGGILTFGGTGAIVKLWKNGEAETLWNEDFGGRFSRMRDAEIGDIYGNGRGDIAVATHDQGVVGVLRAEEDGSFDLQKLDAQENIIVHEIELGDLDGDGVVEIYATPTAPNKVDGTPQPGEVVRYVPAAGEGRVVVADLEDRHAKEILVEDVDGDGRDELYVSVEAVSGGKVEIRRYDADTDPTAKNVVAEIDDKLCRFLVASDVDGDSKSEMIAAASKAGLWILRPGDPWTTELIDADSTAFEHATIAEDLDGDGRDELYVASDNQKEIRRYTYQNGAWQKDILTLYTDGLSRFTWNMMPAPVSLMPEGTQPF